MLQALIDRSGHQEVLIQHWTQSVEQLSPKLGGRAEGAPSNAGGGGMAFMDTGTRVKSEPSEAMAAESGSLTDEVWVPMTEPDVRALSIEHLLARLNAGADELDKRSSVLREARVSLSPSKRTSICVNLWLLSPLWCCLCNPSIQCGHTRTQARISSVECCRSRFSRPPTSPQTFTLADMHPHPTTCRHDHVPSFAVALLDHPLTRL